MFITVPARLFLGDNCTFRFMQDLCKYELNDNSIPFLMTGIFCSIVLKALSEHSNTLFHFHVISETMAEGGEPPAVFKIEKVGTLYVASEQTVINIDKSSVGKLSITSNQGRKQGLYDSFVITRDFRHTIETKSSRAFVYC